MGLTKLFNKRKNISFGFILLFLATIQLLINAGIDYLEAFYGLKINFVGQILIVLFLLATIMMSLVGVIIVILDFVRNLREDSDEKLIFPRFLLVSLQMLILKDRQDDFLADFEERYAADFRRLGSRKALFNSLFDLFQSLFSLAKEWLRRKIKRVFRIAK